MNLVIYLDYSATTPVSDTALAVYNEITRKYFGNPGSLHDIGSAAEDILSICRRALAKMLNADAKGIYFTGSGSEANHLAVRSLVKGNDSHGNHLITSQVEHPSNLHTFQLLEQEGYEVTYLPVDRYGRVRLDALAKAVTPRTILVSIIHANSEIGTIQPIEEIGKFLSEKRILFHSDCVQTFGKVPIDVKKARLHSISISSHKVYGPKGVGAVFMAPEVPWKSVIPGTTQEKGFRPGTVNVPGVAAFVAAAKETLERMEADAKHCRALRDRLLAGLRGQGWNVVLEGHPAERLPHHLALRFPGIEGQYLLLELNRHGIAISTGTACQAGSQLPSQTMLAIGRTKQEADEFIRVTVGRQTTSEEIERTLAVFEKILQEYFQKTTVVADERQKVPK